MKRLIFVQSHPEMEDRVFSMDDQPLLVSQHHYTHILLDVINNEGDNHTLLYLSLGEPHDCVCVCVRERNLNGPIPRERQVPPPLVTVARPPKRSHNTTERYPNVR